MTIQKKSLISTLQTAKKANVASAPLAEEDAKGTKGVKLAKATSLRMAKASSLRMAKAAKFAKAGAAVKMAKATRLARKVRAARFGRVANA